MDYVLEMTPRCLSWPRVPFLPEVRLIASAVESELAWGVPGESKNGSPVQSSKALIFSSYYHYSI